MVPQQFSWLPSTSLGIRPWEAGASFHATGVVGCAIQNQKADVSVCAVLSASFDDSSPIFAFEFLHGAIDPTLFLSPSRACSYVVQSF